MVAVEGEGNGGGRAERCTIAEIGNERFAQVSLNAQVGGLEGPDPDEPDRWFRKAGSS